jgi:hypothetical protein
MCFTGFEEDGVLRLNYGEAKDSKRKKVGVRVGMATSGPNMFLISLIYLK